MTEVIIVAGPGDGGSLVADHIAREATRNPTLTLGVATGTTPVPVYRALAARVDAGLDLTAVRAFALDEYVGLPPRHPQSYYAVVNREITVPLGLNPNLVHVPPTDETMIQTAGERFENAIRGAGGIDIQLLGIGRDGHVGFNEPGSSFGSRTRVKTLTDVTRLDNARFFDSPDDVPRHAVTQGLGTIAAARHLILLAFGEAKADMVAAAVEGPLTSSVPASMIQFHAHATVVVDEAAASKLTRSAYYRDVAAHKPAWQGL